MDRTLTKPASRLLLYCLVTLFTVLHYSCRRQGDDAGASVWLKVKGSNGETIWLHRITLEEPVVVDSARLDRQGEARFSITTGDFDFFLLKMGQARPILLSVEAGEQIEIYTSASRFGEEYDVQGSGASSLLKELDARKSLLRYQLDSLGNTWNRVEYADDKLEQKRILDSMADVFQTAHKNWLSDFIGRYPESPASILALYQIAGPSGPVFTLQNDSSLFFGLGKTLLARYPGNIHVKDLVKRNEVYREEVAAWRLREQLLEPGKDAPPADLITTSGEKLSLSSQQGNIVLLYFWDARKKECWDINLQLAGLYKLYNNQGFRIWGIYTGEDKQLLYNAIQIDRLPWTHLFATSGVVKTYNADPVPSMTLVGRDGKILLRNFTVQQLSGRLPYLLQQTQPNVN
ncbi:MAG TPA: redoxin domain-containing protein [Bacteroidales bacterium]|nr:redoxin domain-containing protein [Bacteroidales bacterium]HRZ48178.1 redoxin domain-containing protein [Bacteroidales bacterium]